MKQDMANSRNEMTSKEMNLLAGRMLVDEVPSVQAHVVRIYLCSAGTDTVTERDAFVETVYPRLRSYCRDKYGMELQKQFVLNTISY
ncbi:hypothetical protein Btru_013102 [Bulinus truncatus]|nr:hypothetical protein Btru_013102 [Bulinus truncatus]